MIIYQKKKVKIILKKKNNQQNIEIESKQTEISHIINVEGKPLYQKLEIFIKLLEFS